MSAAHPLIPESRLIAARDLAGLVLALVIAVAPHALRAPWWLTLLTLTLYLWRAAALFGRAPLPSRWIVLAIALVAMLGIWLEYRTIFGRVAGIVLLVLFSGLKLLETRSHRDAAMTAFLCYFLVITNFLYTQSIPAAIAMGAALAVNTATLVGLAAPRRALGANLRTTALLLAHAAPAALAIFLLFPRVQGPMWGLPQDAYGGVTGLSDTMSPGNLSKLALSDALAFRAEFEEGIPPPRLRYWRGPVLWDFDGRTWRAGMTLLAEPPPAPRGGRSWRYAVVLEPHQRNWLFALESPVRRPQAANFTSDGQVLSSSPVRNRLRYDMVSVTGAQGAPYEDSGELRRALQLPRDTNPRATALAERWRQASASDAQLLERALEFFRSSRLVYTLEPPLLGRDPVDEFLFDTRAGFCEHFASAFVFLMRAAGVPARVVTGYLGGDPNPVDGILTVRQSDAHAWAEVFVAGRGWVRVDPTAASVPGRLDAGLLRALQSDAALPLLMRPELEWLRQLRYSWEALAHRWNVWVLGYNPERQRELMQWFGMQRVDWRSLGATLLAVMGAFIVLLLAWSLRPPARRDPALAAWESFCARLGARGLARAPHEGPRDFAERAAGALPQAAEAIRAIGALYIALRYGRQARPGELDELRRRVRELRLA